MLLPFPIIFQEWLQYRGWLDPGYTPDGDINNEATRRAWFSATQALGIDHLTPPELLILPLADQAWITARWDSHHDGAATRAAYKAKDDANQKGEHDRMINNHKIIARWLRDLDRALAENPDNERILAADPTFKGLAMVVGYPCPPGFTVEDLMPANRGVIPPRFAKGEGTPTYGRQVRAVGPTETTAVRRPRIRAGIQ